jgi:hypothetical protein
MKKNKKYRKKKKRNRVEYKIEVLVELEQIGENVPKQQYAKRMELDFLPRCQMWIEFRFFMAQVASIIYIEKNHSFYIKMKKIFGDLEVMHRSIIASGFHVVDNI